VTSAGWMLCPTAGGRIVHTDPHCLKGKRKHRYR